MRVFLFSMAILSTHTLTHTHTTVAHFKKYTFGTYTYTFYFQHSALVLSLVLMRTGSLPTELTIRHEDGAKCIWQESQSEYWSTTYIFVTQSFTWGRESVATSSQLKRLIQWHQLIIKSDHQRESYAWKIWSIRYCRVGTAHISHS